MKLLFVDYHLKNDRVYSVAYTSEPYVNQEYPTGGFIIHGVMPNGQRYYVDNSPNLVCVENFLKAMERPSSFRDDLN